MEIRVMFISNAFAHKLVVNYHSVSVPSTITMEGLEFRVWFRPDTGKPILLVRECDTDRIIPTRRRGEKNWIVGLPLYPQQLHWLASLADGDKIELDI